MKKAISTLLILAYSVSSYCQTTIMMKKRGDVFIVPCRVNGLNLEFIFDTGAGDVTISLTEALFMLKNGYLRESDIIGKEYYRIANGEIAEGTQINIREIEFAGLKLYNVRASIMHKADAPLLLGQSLISMLGKIQLDPSNNTLTVFNSNNSYNYSSYTYPNLISTSRSYNNNDDYSYNDYKLAISAFEAYNHGVRDYNSKNYNDAIYYMREVVTLLEANGGSLYNTNPRKYDTIAVEANQTIAMSYYNLGRYHEAIEILNQIKNNPITKSPAIYQSLIYAYIMVNKKTESYAIIKEARAYYPDDVTIRNYELNYYISSGNQNELISKLEQAASKDPYNADIQFNIATSYLSMANPKSGTKPGNLSELFYKSEIAFQKAIQLSPTNPFYNYNFGALYFNQATDMNDQMNAITGTSEADEQKYDALKARRDNYFLKSTPYFEKAYSILVNKENYLDDADKKTYKNTILALKEVYARQNKHDKSAEMKRKYESF